MMYDSMYYDAKSDDDPGLDRFDNGDASRAGQLNGRVSEGARLSSAVLEGSVPNDAWDFRSLPTTGVLLQDDSFRQAGDLGQSVVWSDRQWSTYQQALAVMGFEQWLQRYSDINVSRDRCSTFEPSQANLIAAATNLQVGEFKVCLIPVGGGEGDDLVDVPRAVLDLPQLSAHFYVLVEILEDCGFVQALGVATRQHLLNCCYQSDSATTSSGEESWNFLCSKAWFKDSIEDLLLWLRAASPSQIEFPQPITVPVSDRLRSMLQQLQPTLTHQPIWQVLAWSEAMPLLVNPGWMEWLLGTSKGQANLPLPVGAETLGAQAGLGYTEGMSYAPGAQLLDRALNVGMWLHDRVGTLGEELAWMMMPPMSLSLSQQTSELAVGMRDIEEDVDSIIGQLTLDGLEIPTYARGAYREVQWAERRLRLYAVTWPHLSEDNVPEWTLLLVLGPAPGQGLPPLTRLRVRDASQLLVEQISSSQLDDGYLYAHVVGTWDEQFWATIDSDCTDFGGETTSYCSAIYLPPFQFKPGAVQL